MRKSGGLVECLKLFGPCTLSIDGGEVAEKVTSREGSHHAPLPAGTQKVRLSIQFHAKAGQPYGFGDNVRIRA